MGGRWEERAGNSQGEEGGRQSRRRISERERASLRTDRIHIRNQCSLLLHDPSRLHARIVVVFGYVTGITRLLL